MKKIKIVGIKEGSIAEELEICKGDYLLSVNEQEIIDILDYKFQMSDEYVVIEILHDDEIIEYEIEKELDEDIGLIFENELIDNPKRCMNKCVFCFMDQLPDNMRKTLIFKDDDYRLSFLTGNYVTLTNCNDSDIDRIIKYRLSPINISVHTTNFELRKKMLNNKNADNILKYIKKLYDNEIYMNGQIVLCPDLNDKAELIKTIEDLSKYYPYMQSVSIVPVGLTDYREKLYKLRPFSKQECADTIENITKIQKNFKKEFNNNFVYLSDEFYIKAEYDMPNTKEYDEFPQLENGVGMVSLFLQEFEEELEDIKDRIIDLKGKTVCIVTGKLVKKYIENCAKILNKKFNINILVYDIENSFFGSNITVAGLLTGNDIYEQLIGKEIGEKIYICHNMLKDDEDIFLDDVLVNDLSKNINNSVVILRSDGKSFIRQLLEYDE